MSKNWPGEIEEKLILTDDPHHKIPYSGSDGIKEKFYAKTKNRKKVPKRVLILAATLLIMRRMRKKILRILPFLLMSASPFPGTKALWILLERVY